LSPVLRRLDARIVFDSRGDKSIEVEAEVDGHTARAAAPAGKSRGSGEAVPYPPDGPDAGPLVVRKILAPKLLGREFISLEALDEELAKIDGSPNFASIGGNIALAVSVAVNSATAASLGKPLYRHLNDLCGTETALPLPLGNVLGGGKHAGSGAPEFQEYLSLPIGAGSIMKAIEANILVHRVLGALLEKNVPRYPLGRGDEGSYARPINVEKALELVSEAAAEASDRLGFKVAIGLDIAGSSIYDSKSRRYVLPSQGLYLTTNEYMEYISELTDRYGLIYLEDPFREDDLESFIELTRVLNKTYVCGDDLLVTREERIRDAASRRAVRAVIIKPNQVGTLLLTWRAVKAATSSGILPVASHRSGETTDAYLSHIAVGMGCKVIKSGILGGERMAKLNELLRIGEEVGEDNLWRVSYPV